MFCLSLAGISIRGSYFPPIMLFSIRERIPALSGFMEELNTDPYDCRGMVDERLVFHFGLSSKVVTLEEPLSITSSRSHFLCFFFGYFIISPLYSLFYKHIMFNKLLNDSIQGRPGRGQATPIGRTFGSIPVPVILERSTKQEPSKVFQVGLGKLL